MHSAEFSVVLVAKNEELRIRDSLESILKLNPSEIIIIDGDSNDNTVKIVMVINICTNLLEYLK